MADTKVTRIKASDDALEKKASKPAKAAQKTPTSSKTRSNPIKQLGGYFKGAWQELRLVRWPTRRATWSLTFAVIAFTLFIGIIIVLLDLLFNYLFELAIG